MKGTNLIILLIFSTFLACKKSENKKEIIKTLENLLFKKNEKTIVNTLAKKVNKKLMSIHTKNYYIANIKIVNINDNANKHNFFTLKSIIKNIFQSDNIILHKLLLEYPFMIELEVRPEYFIDIIGIVLRKKM